MPGTDIKEQINWVRLEHKLLQDEGIRLYPYKDIFGHTTIGVGHRVRSYETFDETGITVQRAGLLLSDDLLIALHDIESVFDAVVLVDMPIRKLETLIQIMFNLGRSRFLTFKKMIAAIHKLDWARAAEELVDSKYFRQLPTRVGKYAKELAA